MIEIYKLHVQCDSNTSNKINLYKDHNKLNEMWKICHEKSRLNLIK